jgi:hypothetical protein
MIANSLSFSIPPQMIFRCPKWSVWFKIQSNQIKPNKKKMKTLLCLPSFQQKNVHVQLHHPTVLVSSIPKLGSQREQNGIRGFQCAPDHWRDLFKDLLKSPRISEYLKQSLKITETISKNHSNHLQKSLKISKNHWNHLKKSLKPSPKISKNL